MTVRERPGFLAQTGRIPGDHDAGIAVANQKEANADNRTSELGTMIHRSRRRTVKSALREFNHVPVVVQTSSFLRVEG